MYQYGKDFNEKNIELVISEHVGKRQCLNTPMEVGFLPPPLPEEPVYNRRYGYDAVQPAEPGK